MLLLVLAATLTCLAGSAGPAPAAPQGPEQIPGEVIVRFEQGAGPADRAAARDRADVDFERGLGLSGLQLVQAEPGQSATRAIEDLERSDEVAYAEPNFRRSLQAAPSDTHFGLQWGLHNSGQLIGPAAGVADADIDAPEAWALTTGAPSVTVAVIDSGVDSSHPDLAPNIWANPGESGSGRETNRVDDDRNGYVDDAAGWDWVGDDRNPADENDHGTHVAGTVAARGNDGFGVAGVAWQTRVMALRVLDAAGNGTVADVILAYRYAAARGAKVVNLSLGGADLSIAERDAIAAAPGTMFVAAAGNVGANSDAFPEYPCAHALPNVVCVAASDKSDARASFSNYGATSVDLAAPGAQIASTVPGGWAYLDGTSMAAPHVAGAAALVWALRPTAAVAQVKAALLDGVDRKPTFAATTASGGRLNLEGALRAAGASDPPLIPPLPPGPPSDPSPPSSPDPAGSTVDPDPSAPATTPSDGGAPTGRERGLRPSVVANSGQRLGRVLRRGLAVEARCWAPCRMQIRLLVGSRTARKLRLPARTLTVGRRTASLGSNGRSFTLRFAPRLRRGLARMGRLRLTISVSATDARRSEAHTHRSRLVLRR
ncbi:hypothetical protein BH20ACT19_BH20ACT19_06610 [soil metagenome]